MALDTHSEQKLDKILEQQPKIRIFLKLIAPPAALDLAGFAGSTWITSSYIANWWGNADSTVILFPFVASFGGLAQFIAGLFDLAARDVLVTIINTMWGSFRMSVGLLYAFVAAGAIPTHDIYVHFPELASWFIILAFISWFCAIAATARDLVLCGVLFCLAIGSTIACCLFTYGSGVNTGIKAAAYFWMFSTALAWWRTTVHLIEEAYGPNHVITKFFPLSRLPTEKEAPLVIAGLGEPGVKRGVPKMLAVGLWGKKG